MRLINVDTLELQDFSSAERKPPYAILSHTWDGDNEVSFQEVQDLELAQEKPGFWKIHWACLQAKAHGLQFAWVDTCCINKSSSHELAEAINSMWSWYMNAAVCYVYLSDVPGNCPPLNTDFVRPSDLLLIDAFEESRWFTRGWTLQELIAPREVLFFGSHWNPIGALSDLIKRVSDITGIQPDVLDHSQPLSDLSIARRLSWASRRQTTRVEDQAYSLLGILGVNMPLLYGEGSRAFIRLQEEVIKRSTDQSLFAWDAPPGLIESQEQLLAPSPSCFANSGKIRQRIGTSSKSSFWLSNKGLEITLPLMRRQLLEDPARPNVTLGILDCKYEDSSEVLALVMCQHPFNIQSGTPAVEVYVSGFRRRVGNTMRYARLLPVRLSDLAEAKPEPLTITNDLRSQPYMQAVNADEPTSFPIWFVGDPSSVPSVLDVFPEQCWRPNSKTMRLRPPLESHGAIVVLVEDVGSVLIVFGLNGGVTPGSSGATPPRKIYSIVFIDRQCPIEPHMKSLLRHRSNTGGDTECLQLNQEKQLVARLRGSALTIEVERGGGSQKILSSSASLTSSPPSSPTTIGRRTSFPRRDSVITGSRSERSSVGSQQLEERRVHRTRECERCRYTRAKDLADRRREDERATQQQKNDRQKKMMTTAKQAGMTFTISSMLADAAEFLV